VPEGVFVYIRTSGDDSACEKLGVDVQRTACNSIARHLGLVLTGEFVDDGVSGKVPMHSRPQGKRMMAYLLANGTKTIITYDGKRIGRTQPVYWAFIGMARDNDIQVLDKDGKNLCESILGGIEGLMSELDHTATVARLQAGKKVHRERGERVEGRWPYGSHPHVKYAGERDVVTRIRRLHAAGRTCYAIAKTLNREGVRTRYGKVFTPTTVRNILVRIGESGVAS